MSIMSLDDPSSSMPARPDGTDHADRTSHDDAADRHDHSLVSAAHRLASCDRLLVILGAGSSAESGVPTFRDVDGLWQRYKVEELASAEGFARQPEVVWDWYRERRELIAASEPHPGQRTLALLQRHFPGEVLIATTNEDDLLERAGVANVLHVHGSLFDTACAANCGWRQRDDADNGLSFLDCPCCGAPVRPGSVWFGETLPEAPMDRLRHFAADGCLVVGSSSLVQPVAAVAPELALAGHPVVEINPQQTPLSDLATVSIMGTTLDCLPRLIDLLTSPSMRQRAATVGD